MGQDNNYWTDSKRRLSRRRVLQAAGVGAIGVAGLAAVGCGDDDDDGATPGAGGAASPGATQAPVEQPQPGGKLATHASTDPPSLDVFRSASFNTIIPISYTMSRLLRYKPQTDTANYGFYEPEADLAESWTSSPDATTWTFKLRPGVTFHNGSPFTSEDVVASFERFNTLPAANRNGLSIVDKVEAPDPLTVVFKLKSPHVAFANIIASPNYLWIFPKELKAGGYDPAKKVIGTGPFILDSYEVGVAIRYKKNPNYFLAGRPYVDEVTIHIIKDTESQLAQFRSGALDYYALGFGGKDFQSIKAGRPQIQSFESKSVGLWQMWFNALDPADKRYDPKSPFNDPKVRRAVSMAIDRDALNQVLYEGSGFWNNIPPVAMKQGTDPKSPEMGEAAKNFVYSVDGAKKLLAEAGHPNGFEAKLHYALSVYGDTFQQMVDVVSNMLGKAGIKTTLVGQNYASEYIGKTFLGDFAGGLVIGPESAFFEGDEYLFNNFHSTSPRNHSRVKDPEIDRLIAAERGEANPEARTKLIRDITKRNAEQMYQVPLVIETRTSLAQPNVRGFAYGSSYGAGAETAAGLWVKKT